MRRPSATCLTCSSSKEKTRTTTKAFTQGPPCGRYGRGATTTLRRDGLPADEGRKPVVLPRLGARATLDKEVILRIAWDGWRRERSIWRQKALPNQRKAASAPWTVGHKEPAVSFAVSRWIPRRATG